MFEILLITKSKKKSKRGMVGEIREISQRLGSPVHAGKMRAFQSLNQMQAIEKNYVLLYLLGSSTFGGLILFLPVGLAFHLQIPNQPRSLVSKYKRKLCNQKMDGQTSGRRRRYKVWKVRNLGGDAKQQTSPLLATLQHRWSGMFSILFLWWNVCTFFWLSATCSKTSSLKGEQATSLK